MPRIIDCHVHHLDDTDVAWARELGYEKVCLMDPRVEVLEAALKKHPDFVIALGWLPMHDEIDVALDALERFRDAGCLGLKICGSRARYDDESFYPVYEKAEEYGLPIFFHTGWLDQRIMQQTYPTGIRMLADWYRPITLDRITLDFPTLNLVAFHMGGTWVAEAALLMRQYPNIYADSCIPAARLDPPDFFWGQIGGSAGGFQTLAKMVYGTDGMASREACRNRIRDFTELLDALEVPAGLQDRILYRNALHILGLDEELKKKIRVHRIDASKMTVENALSNAAPSGATCVSDFLDHTLECFGEPTRFKTNCWIGCDDDALHLLFYCEDESADAPVVSREGPIAGIYQDDSVEVFLSPGADEAYFHFIVNAAGRASVQEGRGDIRDFPHAVESRITKAGWAVKLSVPFSLLGAVPARGATWGMQLSRNKRTHPKETITWTEVATTFHDPSNFGRLVFA